MMKKLIKRLLVIALAFGLILAGCTKDPNHSIRVKNNYPETINSLKVGYASYGDVKSGALTGYLHVEEGVNSLTGNTATGASISGTVTVSGKGSHQWTLTILNSGGVTISED